VSRNLLDRILGQRIDGEISACRWRELQLVRGDIDRDNLQAHRLGILDRHVA
jgi:hypothetical protein